MAIVRHRQWGDQHRGQPYPFKDTATLRDSSGEFEINPSWIKDASIWPITGSSRVFLRSIERKVDQLTFTISSLEETLMTATVGRSDLSRSRLAFYDSTGYQSGFFQLSAGALASIYDNPTGIYRFGVNATEFVPKVVVPRSVSGVVSISDGDTPLTDEVRMVGGDGVELVGSTGQVKVNVIGDSLYRRDVCEDPQVLGRLMNPVRKIMWLDLTTGRQGTLVPRKGQIFSTISDGSTERGHRAPSRLGALIEQVRR